MVKVERVGSAQEFLDATLALRSREPVLTNVIGSVATDVAAGRQYESETWLVVRDGDEVVGCAIRTAPWPASLSPMPVDAALLVGRALADVVPVVTDVAGPAAAVRAALEGLGDRPSAVVTTDIARVLVQLVPPRRACPGSARRCTEGDLDLVAGWLAAFATEAGLPGYDPHEMAAAMTADARLWLWEVDGVPVAMAGHAPTVQTPSGRVGRIGPVYTPSEHRRRGYGDAATRTVATELLTTCATVMLYADADNPDSNSVYAAMGFEAVGEMAHVRLELPCR